MTIDAVQVVLNVTMITEISIRVCAMGKEFWQHWWNLLDAGVSLLLDALNGETLTDSDLLLR